MTVKTAVAILVAGLAFVSASEGGAAETEKAVGDAGAGPPPPAASAPGLGPAPAAATKGPQGGSTAERPPPVTTMQELIIQVDDIATAGIAVLDEYRERIAEIAADAERTNRHCAKKQKDGERCTEPFFEKYRVLWFSVDMFVWTDKNLRIVSRPDEVARAIQGRRNELSRVQSCLVRWRYGHTAQMPDECADGLRFACDGAVGYDGGRLFQLRVDQKLDLHKNYIETADEYEPLNARWEEFNRDWRFYRCRLAAWALAGREPASLSFESEDVLFSLPIQSLTDFGNHCGNEGEGAAATLRLKYLRQQYQQDATLLRWEKEFLPWKRKRCGEIAAQACADVYKIRDTFALAYVTKGCEIRRVTVKDVQSDVERWSGFQTDAELQVHRTLADRLQACAAARAAGIDWKFVEPKLPSSCRKKVSKDRPPSGKTRKSKKETQDL